MCDLHEHGAFGLEPLEHDEYVLDTPAVRGFVAASERRSAGAATPAQAIAAIEPSFAELLAPAGGSPTALPARSARERDGRRHRPVAPVPLGRSLAVPLQPRRAARRGTPIHDHGAWGLVGLYRGNQDEELYRPAGGGLELDAAAPARARRLVRALPPRTTSTGSRTTSDETSVSIHLLANDTGCVLRHVYDEETGDTRPFRSGYVNAACPEGDPVT